MISSSYKKKVLLIYPLFNKKQNYNVLTNYFNVTMPLGLGFIIGSLLKENIDVSLIDEQIEPLNFEKMITLINQNKIPAHHNYHTYLHYILFPYSKI